MLCVGLMDCTAKKKNISASCSLCFTSTPELPEISFYHRKSVVLCVHTSCNVAECISTMFPSVFHSCFTVGHFLWALLFFFDDVFWIAMQHTVDTCMCFATM